MSLVSGTLIADRFEIERLAGQGGMGAVYRARDRRSGEPVALKLLQEVRSSLQEPERFTREARVLASLTHPNIVRVHDFGLSDAGDPFIVMERLEGEDLRDRLQRTGRIPADIAMASAAGN